MVKRINCKLQGLSDKEWNSPNKRLILLRLIFAYWNGKFWSKLTVSPYDTCKAHQCKSQWQGLYLANIQ
jgi:hypothetical protein